MTKQTHVALNSALEFLFDRAIRVISRRRLCTFTVRIADQYPQSVFVCRYMPDICVGHFALNGKMDAKDAAVVCTGLELLLQ